MPIYIKYLNRRLLVSFAVVLFVVISIVWLTQSLRFIELITSGSVDFLMFLKISSFLILPMAYVCIPIALFLALIITVHNLNADHEIEILKCSGLSDVQIFKGFVAILTGVMLVHFIVSLYLLPNSYRYFKEMQHLIKDQFIFSAFEEGVFNTQNSNITVYIDKKVSQNEFTGIFIYDFRNSNKPITITASSGKLYKTDNGISFILMDGTKQLDDNESGNISLAFFSSYKFNLLNEQEDKERYIDVNEMFLSDLLEREGKTEHQIKTHIVIAMQRISWPLLNLVLSIVVCSIMFKSVSKRQLAFKQELKAGVASICLITGLLLLNQLALKHFDYIYYSIVLIFISVIAGIVGLIRY
ncbi:MAG: LptF/LptG family permease, partial [Alphaproteobacteria bacterium]